MSPTPFHLAVPVHDLAAAREFYGTFLGCREGRSAPRWVDYDFFGHQVSLHLVDDMSTGPATNRVDGDDVPVRHFGVILPREDWSRVAERCRASGLSFLVAPRIRFEGTAGEQGTFFVRDPSGNALEFKTFADHDRIFAVDEAAI